MKTLPVWAGVIMGAWFGAMLLLAVVAVAAVRGVWGLRVPRIFRRNVAVGRDPDFGPEASHSGSAEQGPTSTEGVAMVRMPVKE